MSESYITGMSHLFVSNDTGVGCKETERSVCMQRPLGISKQTGCYKQTDLQILNPHFRTKSAGYDVTLTSFAAYFVTLAISFCQVVRN